MLLAEQRHQRRDLGLLLRKQEMVLNHLNLQKQVDDYFDKDDENDIPEVDKESTKADLD